MAHESPSSQLFSLLYIVTPQRRLLDDPKSFLTEHWQSGTQTLQRKLNQQTDASFPGTAHTKLYWIGAIGPYWRYGERDYEQDLIPLIDWHHTTHDQASFNDLRDLVDLVSALYIFIFQPISQL